MKTKILLILIMLLAMAGVGYAGECNVDFSDGCTVSANMVLNGSIFDCTDSGNDGCIRMVTNHVTLDCNGTWLRGTNAGYGIYTAGDNITLRNCNVSNWVRAIWNPTGHNNLIMSNRVSDSGVLIRVTTSQNVTLQNNTLENGTTYGIEVTDRNKNITIEYNTIDTTSNDAIRLDLSVNYSNIRYNNLTDVTDGILFDRYARYNNVYGNIINGTTFGSNGIHSEDDSTNLLVYDNKGENIGWNWLDLETRNNVAYNNFDYNTQHHGIDQCVGNTATNSVNNTFYSNTIIKTRSSGIYLCEGINLTIYNNTISNANGSGIVAEGNSSVLRNNTIYNNSIYNVTGSCLWAETVNTTWINNTFSNCGTNDIHIGAYHNKKSQLETSIFETWSQTYTFTLTFWVNASPKLKCGNQAQQYNFSSGESWSISACDVGCVFPYDSRSYTGSNTLCKMEGYIDDTADDGQIVIGGDNVQINMNGAILHGKRASGSLGIKSNGKDRVLIENGVITDYYKNTFANGYNLTLKNMTFKNMSNYPIQASFMDNMTINGSFIYPHSNWVYFEKSSENSIITDSTFNQTGLKVDGGSRNTTIYGNTFLDTPSTSIYVDVNQSHIHDNIITDSLYNSIMFLGYTNYIISNTINGWAHNGIDIHVDGNGVVYGGNSIIASNRITGDASQTGISLDDTTGNLVYNNTITNTNISIVINGQNFAINNRVYNNTFDTSSRQCLLTVGQNNITNNSFSGCGTEEIKFGEYNISRLAYLRYNIFDNSLINYWFTGSGNNISINETESDDYIINFSNNGYIKFDSTSNKDLLIENLSIRIQHDSFPTFSTFCYPNNSTCTQNLAHDISFTIGANQFGYLVSQVEDDDPELTSKATTITDYTMDYREGYILDIDCSGTGTHIVTNLDDLGDSYAVYHNRVLVGVFETVQYTMTGCSGWSFVSGSTIALRYPTIAGNIGSGFDMFSVVLIVNAAVLIISVGLALGGIVDFEQAGKLIIIIIVTSIILLLGYVVFVRVGQVGM